MTLPKYEALLEALNATWPSARDFVDAGWRFRDGANGGQRASAATALSDAPDIVTLEATQAAMGDYPLVMIRDGEPHLDERLDDAGFILRDTTCLYVARCSDMAIAPPPVTGFVTEWPPLTIQTELWDAVGLSSSRRAVMERVAGAKVAIMGRTNDRPAGIAFCACAQTSAGKIAMIHALEVLPDFRRQKVAAHMMGTAAIWAQNQGAEWLSVAVTQANTGAISLYTSLGMQLVGHYHYRAKPPHAEQEGQSG